MALTLKAARVNKELTQKEAAEKLGISDRTLSLWENGKCFPNVPQIAKIEKLYCIPYKDINFYPD